MCTVSWLQSSDGYELRCNRDERRTRLPGTAPLQQYRSGVSFIAPLDGNHGGSWMAVNQFRISFCLLNRYVSLDTSQDEKKIYRSRGLLLLDLVDAHSLSEAWERASRFPLEEYPPFTLVALEPAAPALLLDWTGRQLFHQFTGEKLMLLVSSSSDQRAAESARRDLFDKMRAERGSNDAAWLYAFHSSHLPYRGAYSPCMHRADASTVSYSSVQVAGDHIEFSYFPGAPCEQKESVQRRGKGKSAQTLILPTVDAWAEVR